MTDDDLGIEPGVPFIGPSPIDGGDPDRHTEPKGAIKPDTIIGRRFKVSEIEAILRPAFGMAEAVNSGRVVKADLTPTEDELRDIAVPLTAIVNRNDHLRQLAEKGDGIALIMALGRYGVRVGGDHVYHSQLEREAAELEQLDDPNPFAGGAAA